MNVNSDKIFENSQELLALLSEADIATLTLVLSQLTNSSKYLNIIRPYVKGAFDYSVKVPEEIANTIRNELTKYIIKNNNKNNILPNLSDNFLKELMSVGVGENVPDEYVPMMKEELSLNGNVLRDLHVEKIKNNKNINNINVIIIGAGLCGILAGINFYKLIFLLKL